MTHDLPPQGADVDIIALVAADHRAVRALFDQILDAPPDARAAYWPDLLHSLAVHEVAEELVVFPAVRVISNEYEAVLGARIEEQKEAEQLLVSMEDLDPSSDEFATALRRLHGSVLAHAEAEEREVLPVIVRHDDALDRPTLGARFLAAKRRAPTHPHPGAPHTPPGNVLAGPMLSAFDRLRDHMG